MVARFEKAGLKSPALVGCDLLGTAETSNPDGDKGLSNCLCGDLRDRECLRPMGVSVEGSETVPETRRDRQRPDQVNMCQRLSGQGNISVEQGYLLICKGWLKLGVL
jgi:hypothetical protein